MYVNKTAIFTWADAGVASGLKWTGMRDRDNVAQLPTVVGMRNIRYWDYGLSNDQLVGLFTA